MLLFIFMKSYYDQFKEYKVHFEEWCKFDLINIGDKAMQAINQKQWVVARLYDTKRERDMLIRKRNNLKKTIIDKLIEKSPVNLDKNTLNEIDKSPQFEEINEQLQDIELLIKYLEEMTKMFMYIAQDVKNVIDSIRLESN